jgi:hypothetical protein
MRWVLVVRFFAIVVALHAPSWFAIWVFQAPPSEERPLFNLDLILAAAIACVSSLAGGIALMLAWTADFTRAAAKNYHFMSALDFVDAARFVDMLNLRTFLSASLLVLIAGLLACVWVVLRLTRLSRPLALPLLAAAALAVGCDAVNGSFHLFGFEKDSRIVHVNFAGSPTWNIWGAERQSFMASGLSPMPEPATFRALRDWQIEHPSRTSMLVLVESLGWPRAPALQDWLRSRLETRRLATRWTMRQSDEAFIGSTTSGELRALCGLRGHYSQLNDAQAAGCLPRLFATQGVSSLGIHGFGLRMFDRNDWWPRIGLKPWLWTEVDHKAVPMNCNQAFSGVCDSAVIERAVVEAQQPARFVYALTLDTHLPLDLRQTPPLPMELQAACAVSSTPDESCQLVRKLGDLLARLEISLAESAAAPFVVIVGDHAPPFGERVNREAFVEGRVPMFVLTPHAAP